MTLPIKAEVKIDQKVKWDEITRLTDVSSFGAGFTLSRPVKRGRLMLLTIPLPRRLRAYDHSEPQYKVWAIVRRCVKIDTPSLRGDLYAVGVAFVGQNPPSSFLSDPSLIYEITHREQDGLWSISIVDDNNVDDELPKDARKHSRYMIPMNVTIEVIDEEGNPGISEQTVTENLSYSGASVFSSLDAEIGSFIRVTSDQINISIISIVRGKRLGEDGIPRLHIEFIDHFFPLEGIEQN